MALVTPFSPALDRVLPPARALALLAGQSAIAALAALLILRRSRASRKGIALWVIIALIGGVSGLLLMAATRYWPPRVRCPHCRQRRLASAPRCEHCNAEFPAADPGPIGIFDQGKVLAQT